MMVAPAINRHFAVHDSRLTPAERAPPRSRHARPTLSRRPPRAAARAGNSLKKLF
jgi:hypothetical protein